MKINGNKSSKVPPNQFDQRSHSNTNPSNPQMSKNLLESIKDMISTGIKECRESIMSEVRRYNHSPPENIALQPPPSPIQQPTQNYLANQTFPPPHSTQAQQPTHSHQPNQAMPWQSMSGSQVVNPQPLPVMASMIPHQMVHNQNSHQSFY